ncbi:hypothetical protein I3843_04G107800 [Carya illinoinensis]|nr:hypothetical protein I3843_04G107800 [Carya illinoinensis]
MARTLHLTFVAILIDGFFQCHLIPETPHILFFREFPCLSEKRKCNFPRKLPNKDLIWTHLNDK